MNLAHSQFATPIILAAAQATGSTDPVLDDIQWMPPGTHTLTPTINGRPQEVTLTIDEAMAGRLIASFGALRSAFNAGTGDEPFFDYAHRNQDASGHPTELYWGGEDPKTGGIRAKVRWTGAGRSAIAGKAFTRFSPAWVPDPNTGEPLGLTPNLGGLVNHAAFSTIQRVRAGAAHAGDPDSPKMNETHIQAAVAAAVTTALAPVLTRLTTLETAHAGASGGSNAQAGAAGTGATNASTDPAILERINSLERTTRDNAAAHASRCVQTAIAEGRLAPQDTASAGFWQTAIATQGAAAESQLRALPVNPAFLTVATAGANGGAAGAGGNSAVGTAQGFVDGIAKAMAADKTLTRATALTAAVAANPAGYKAWRDDGAKLKF